MIEAYDQTKYPNLPLDVVAIYPVEGTFWSDHPFAILNAPWVTDELRVAAEAYRDFLLAPEQQQQALQYGFRPSSVDIPIGAPLIEANGVDPTQPQTLLDVPNADVIRAIRDLWGENKKPVEIQVILDTSGSMDEERRLARAREALTIFINNLADNDYLGIVTFSEQATELTPLSAIGPKRADVVQSVSSLFPQGGTRLIDTVDEVYRAMQQEPAGERIRAIVVLSDGDDTDSLGSVSDLTQLLQQDESGQSIKVFTIAYGTGTDVDVELMQAIATASGAKSYIRVPPAEIEQVYRDIATFF